MNLMEKYLGRMTNTEKPVTKVTEVSMATMPETDIKKMSLSEFEKAGLIVKIWSDILNDYIYFVSNDAVITLNPLDLVSYTAKELTAMLGMQPEEVRTAHTVKSIFSKAKVTQHRRVAA